MAACAQNRHFGWCCRGHALRAYCGILCAFAIPLISLVVVPLTLLGSLLPLDWPLELAHMVMTACMHCLQWLATLPMSTWQQHAPPGWTLLLAILGVLWILLPRGFPMRWV